MTLRSTEIETFQRALISVPNADILSQPLTNWNARGQSVRLDLRVPVAFEADITATREALEDEVRRCPGVAAEPAPEVLAKAFADSFVEFEVRAHVSPDSLGPVRSELLLAIHRRMRRDGFAFRTQPFPAAPLGALGPLPGPAANDAA